MDDQETDMIKREMDQTRASLAKKLESLGVRATETVEETGEAVSDAVQTVTEAVSDTSEVVQKTIEPIRKALNFPAHIKRHPWLMLGGAVAVGYVATRMFSGSSSRQPSEARIQQPVSPAPVPELERPRIADVESTNEESQESQASSQENSNGWTQALDRSLGSVSQLGLGLLFGLIRESVARPLSQAVNVPLTDFVDDITTSLGGKTLKREQLMGTSQTTDGETTDSDTTRAPTTRNSPATKKMARASA